MTTPWKTVRVFISSTFRDMHAERDFLVHDVFLELKERCAKRQLHLIDVDLRWGVTEEEEKQGKVLEICLDEIERCRPFFIGLLGERYGSTPPRYDVPDDEKYHWIKELEERDVGPSVTALEIYHGVLHNPSMRTRAFFYFRDPSFLKNPALLSEVPAEKQKDFLPESADAARKLKALKDEIKEHSPVFENYPCQYGGLDDKGQVKLTGLDDFGKRLLEEVWEAIKLEHPEDSTPSDELAIERSYHEAFIENRSQRFVGRRDVLAQLTAFAASENESALVVTGKAGCGKSAVLAYFVREYAARHPEEFVLAHFVGVSPGSTDIRRTLLRLCRELAGQFSIQDEIPTDYYELRQTFVKFLEQSTAQGKVLLVLDALNQLDESHYAHALDWLPQSLPGGLKIIVSTVDDSDCLEALRRRSPAPREVVVGALTEAERREIVQQTLAVYRKHLDERPENDQMGLLLGKHESDSPLYLTVACEEMRVFGEFERVTKRIEALPDEVESLFEQVLERIEDDHENVEPNRGKQRVRDALSLLECSRHGLLESEMLELLAPDGEEHLPQAIWARLYRGLKFYLRPSGSDEGAGESDEGLLDFFHRQLTKAVRQKYLNNKAAEVASHIRLAKYFRRKADPHDNRGWSSNYPRALSELPHHFLAAKFYDDLFRVARDESFLRAQSAAFQDNPELQIQTLQNAITGAAQIDDAAGMAEFVLAHARRVTTTHHESPIEALRKTGLERAWRLADLFEIERSVQWHLLVAWELNDIGMADSAKATLERVKKKGCHRITDLWQSKITSALLAQVCEVYPVLFVELRNALLDDSGRSELSKALAAQGEFDVALTTALSIDESSFRAAALRAIAAEHIRVGNVDAPIEIAQQVDVRFRSEALMDVSIALSQRGELGSAAKIILQIEDMGLLARAFCELAVALSKAEQPRVAREAFAVAHKAASKLLRPDWRAETLCEIATAEAQSGEVSSAHETFVSALEVAQEIDQIGLRHEAVSKIAIAKALSEDFTVAFATAQQISDKLERDRTLIGILTTKAQAREFGAALEIVPHVADDLEASKALSVIAAAQAEAGELTASRETFVAAISGPRSGILYFLDRHLRKIAVAYAHAEATSSMREMIALAVSSLQKVSDPRIRAASLSEIAITQVQSGDVGNARETFVLALTGLNQIDDAEYRVKALRGIATAWLELGEIADARETLSVALGIARQIRNGHSRGLSLIDIAALQAQAGNFDGALEIAQRIDLTWARSGSLRELTTELVRAGNLTSAHKIFPAALKIARDIDDVFDKGFALTYLARAQYQCGEVLAAAETFVDVLETIQLVDDAWSCAYHLCEMTVLWAQTGEAPISRKAFALAAEIAQKIGDPSLREETLRDIASAQARAGHAAESLSIAKQIGDGWLKAEALCEIAKAQAQSGDTVGAREVLAVALTTALGIADEGCRAVPLTKISEAEATLGDVAAALEIAKSISLPRDRAKALCEIATAQAHSGNGSSARAIFEDAVLTAQEDEGTRTLGEVAMAQARFDVAGALATVKSVNYPSHKAEALREIAIAQARAKEFSAAFQTAQQIGVAEEKSKALREIAIAQVRAGLTMQAGATAFSIPTSRQEYLPEISSAAVLANDLEGFKQLLSPCSYYLDAAYEVCGQLARLYPEKARALASLIGKGPEAERGVNPHATGVNTS